MVVTARKATILITLLSIPTLGLYLYLSGDLDSGVLQLILKKLGDYAPFIYILMHMLRPACLIPSSILVVAAGLVFEPLSGIILCFVGIMAASSVVYLIGKKYGQEWVNRKNPELSRSLYKKLNTTSIVILSSVRLIPVIPADFISYTSGALGIKYSYFIASTFIGSFPGTSLLFFAAAGIRVL